MKRKKPYINLYEHVFFKEKSPSDNNEFFEKLKVKLEESKIPYEDLNSEKNNLHTEKKVSKDKFKVYLESPYFESPKDIYSSQILYEIPHRVIRRIYVEPSSLDKAKEILKACKS